MKKDEEGVIIVSLDDYSWKVILEKKFYAFPKGSRKIEKYFGFYRKKPISAITHYAKVKTIEEGGKEEVGTKYWLYCLPDAEPPFQIVRFDKIIKLKLPIKKDLKRGIQGRIYTTIKKMLNSKKITDLLN